MQINRPMGLVLSKHRLQRFGIFLAFVVLLTACSPKLDWRSVRSPQEGYTALFPGKPEKVDRRLPYDGQEVLQTLEAVKIDDDIYAVSSIRLSKDQTQFLPKLLPQLQSNLLNRASVNLATAVNSDTFYETAARQKIATKDFFLEFPSTGAVETSMRVRWITRSSIDGGVWIYQLSVLHSAPARVDAKKFFSEEAYSNFFDGFHPD